MCSKHPFRAMCCPVNMYCERDISCIVIVTYYVLTQNREEAGGERLSAPLLFVRHPLNTGEQQLGLILVFNPDQSC